MSGLFFGTTMNRTRRMNGFTLIELIMVLAILGVVAVFLAPKLNPRDFEARGFHDETLALLRYAQKTAIAQRRTVCVVFTNSTATLSMAATEGSNSCSVAVVGPKGVSLAAITARSSITYAATPTNFFFNALGQPSVGQSLQVASGGTALSLGITVESETGYVHD